MNNPLINILIRTMPTREAALTRCLQSVREQTYKNYNLFIHNDKSVTKFPYHYNLFCNEMKAEINDGYFFFLDDDDFLLDNTALERVAKHLTDKNEAVICQMIRQDGRVKPVSHDIRSGKIGMPCLILHHSHKHIADIPAEDNGDFLWIKEVSEKLAVRYVDLVLVNSPRRGYGL